MSELTIQNVVGGGTIGTEIDLYSIAKTEFESFRTQYEPESFPGVVFRHNNLEPTVILHRSGKFNIAGGKSISNTRELFNKFCSSLTTETGLEIHPELEIRYFVTTGDLGRQIDLSAAALAFGIDETEYEPEQFPGLFYRPDDRDWFSILFATGSIIIDGTPDIDLLENAYQNIDEKLSTTGV
ncbi:transcription factor [Haloarcula japonica]|uniref:Transcription factor n=1 Tax=Haloarcula japonica (strain ATCC 49778 / DSM 6131 / JCM 7785 / NBRC 101032 / NCIMB 13157 / TR-1) TaxID=1227453 RepID=M0LAW4_HALJT|nr:transcription factor [Haloarcula japonica]EMA29085.1 transcription factor [Haloarcula japonica DSM 6131]